MAKKTPLGTSANFATPPLTPGETEFHAYWGQYTYDATGTPNAISGRSGTVGSRLLPNASAASALANPEFRKLRPGDIASTAFNLAVATGTAPASLAQAQAEGLFACVYPGTAGGGNAVWVRLDYPTQIVQTIRDAHVIVVGLGTGYLAPLASVAVPPLAANSLNLSNTTGDVSAVTCDYLDIGDGAQLAQALSAVAASGVVADVRIRPGFIDLGAGATAVPLVVPAGSRVLGAGRDMTTILSKTANLASQEVFSLGAGCQLSEMTISSTAPATATPGAGTSKAVVNCTGQACRVRHCAITIGGTIRTQPWGIWDASATVEVLDCLFEGSDMDNANTAGRSIAIAIGPDRAVTPNAFVIPTFSKFRVHGCTHVSTGGTGFNQAVLAYNTSGGHVSECDFEGIARPIGGVLGCAYSGVPAGFTSGVPYTVDDVRMSVLATEVGGDPGYAGMVLTNNVDALVLADVQWTSVRVAFSAAVAVSRTAYLMTAAGPNGTAKIDGGSLVGLVTTGHTRGFALTATASAGTATIQDLCFSSCVVKNPTTIGATPGAGFTLVASATNGLINNVAIANCNARGATAGQFGIQLATATVTNTIVVGNALIPAGGTALSDVGTDTEAGHNTLV